MKSMRSTISKSLTFLSILGLITSPLLITTSSAHKINFTSHGNEANPSYAYPSYAYPSYAFPSYAFPSYAFPSYAFPSYAFTDSGTDYYVTPWGLPKVLPTISDNFPLSQLITETKSGNLIKIAVLDTGISNHPDLSDSVTWTYDATGHNDMTDVSGHGTHVAGIIDIFGIAEIYAIKVMDGPNMEGEWSWLEAGIYAAIKGPDGVTGTTDDADIISMSLGSNGEVPPYSIANAIDYAAERDIVLIASAGNSGDGKMSTNDLIQYPAAYSDVIAVGAIDESNKLASFSNTNSYVELVAPGVDILSTFKDGEYAIWSGTSMAAPFVAALSAFLLYQYGSGSSHDMDVGSFTTTRTYKLRGQLHLSPLDLGSTGLDNGYGYGLFRYSP